MGRTITVIGSVNIDLVVRTDRLPREGETVLGQAFEVLPGGKGANQAVAAARLGAAVEFIGAVGSDDYGRAARQNLLGHGIDLSGLATVEAHTGVALIMVDGHGRNLICVAPGANEQVAAGTTRRCDIALTQLETPFRLPAAELVVLNPAPAPVSGSDAASAIVMEGVDVVIPNEIEAEQLTGESDPALAAAALEKMGAGWAIITLGAKGVYDGKSRRYFPAFEVQSVDTVGAGDAFVGGFTAALAREAEDPIRFAQAAAALKCTRKGAQNVPDREEVLEFLAAARR